MLHQEEIFFAYEFSFFVNHQAQYIDASIHNDSFLCTFYFE